MTRSISSQLKADAEAAVFARNHPRYLLKASEVAEDDPGRLITFRSSTRWVSAAKALERQGALDLYFAVIGTEPQVKYQAKLVRVLLDPQYGDDETDHLLGLSLPSTKDEGLWEQYDKPVETLYAIKACHQLSDPFSITSLIKLSDDSPISANYGYSYSVVYRRGNEPASYMETLPGEIENPRRYPEGATRRVSITTYERRSAARRECLDHYGYACLACGFNFEDKYGELGEEFIHVHHIVPLSEVDSGYEVDPISDLRPLCPNCHAMIHRQDPPLTIAELRNIQAANSDDNPGEEH